MHEWHTNTSRNPLRLINEFIGFKYETDYAGTLEILKVKITGNMFSNKDDALNYVTSTSYYSGTAYLAAYTSKKLTKGYQNAYDNFIARYNEYLDFEKNLTIAYGRKSAKVACPSCGSSISLKYGYRFKECPVCGSKKIISDSNWRTLDTKRKMADKAAESLSKEAEKNDVMFVCGIEWHC